MIKERTVRQRQLSCDHCGQIFRGGWDDGYAEMGEVQLIRMAIDFSNWLVRWDGETNRHFCCLACCNAYCSSTERKEASCE